MSGTTIAVDLDEVLGCFLEALIKFHNDTYGTNLSLSDFFSYTFREVWGGTESESTAKVHSFFGSLYFRNIQPVAGAAEAMNMLKTRGFNLVVVTSRQLIIEEQTRLWIAEHFPDIFSDVLFGNAWGTSGRKVSKPELCRKVDASVLIDDSLQYATQCAKEGIRVLLFDWQGMYGWSRSDEELPQLVVRVTSWQQASDQVLRMLT